MLNAWSFTNKVMILFIMAESDKHFTNTKQGNPYENINEWRITSSSFWKRNYYDGRQKAAQPMRWGS